MRTMRSIACHMSPIAVVLLASCDTEPSKPTCEQREERYGASYPTFTVQGAPVAVFALEQDYARFEPAGCNLQGQGGPVRLTVTGTAPVPLSFGYTVQGLGATGLVVWTHSGAVQRLTPGQSIAIGQVARTPVRADIGAAISLTGINVVP